MSSSKLHTVLIGLIAAMFVGLIGGAYQINSMVSQESNKLATLKAKSQALENQDIALRKAQLDIKKYADLEKITATIVPKDKNQAEAVRQIVRLAAANKITIESISFPASTLGNKSPASTSTAADNPVATPGAAASTNLTQLEPVKNISGVYQLTITVNSSTENPVPYQSLSNFLKDLENNRRTALVSSLSIKPDDEKPNLLSFSLNINSYIKPAKWVKI